MAPKTRLRVAALGVFAAAWLGVLTPTARAQVVVVRPWAYRPWVYRPVIVPPVVRVAPVYPVYRPWGYGPRVYRPWVYRPGGYRRWDD